MPAELARKASKGIGAGIAARLASVAAVVVVNDARSAEAAKALVGKNEGGSGEHGG